MLSSSHILGVGEGILISLMTQWKWETLGAGEGILRAGEGGISLPVTPFAGE